LPDGPLTKSLTAVHRSGAGPSPPFTSVVTTDSHPLPRVGHSRGRRGRAHTRRNPSHAPEVLPRHRAPRHRSPAPVHGGPRAHRHRRLPRTRGLGGRL